MYLFNRGEPRVVRVLFIDAFAHSQYDLGGLFYRLRLPGMKLPQRADVLW